MDTEQSYPIDHAEIVDMLTGAGKSLLPGLLGLELLEITRGGAVMRCDIGQQHFAANGYLHGGLIMSIPSPDMDVSATFPRERMASRRSKPRQIL